MKVKDFMVGALSLACLAGCAGKNTQVVKATNGSTLKAVSIFAPPEMNGNRYADTKLREVTPRGSADQAFNAAPEPYGSGSDVLRPMPDRSG